MASMERAGSIRKERDPVGDAAQGTGHAVGAAVRHVDEFGRAVNESSENQNAFVNSPATKSARLDPTAEAQRALEKVQAASSEAMEDVQVGGRHQHVFDSSTGGDNVGDAVKGVQRNAQHQADRAGNAVQRGFNDASRDSGLLGATESVAEGAGRVAGSAVNTAERVGEGLNEAGAEVAQGARNLTEAVSVTMQDVTESVADGVARTADATADGYHDARNGAQRNVDRAADATRDAGNAVRDNANRAGDDIAHGADTLAKRTAEGAGAVVGGVAGAVEGVAHQTGNLLTNIVNSVGHAFDKAGDGYNDGKANVHSVGHSADANMRDAANSVKATGHDAKESVKSAGRDVKDSIKDATSDAQRSTDDVLRDAKRDAQNAIDDLKVDHPLIERDDAADHIPVVPFTSTAEMVAEHKV